MANVTLNVTDNQGNATGTVEAPAEIFGFSAEEVQSRIPLIHQVAEKGSFYRSADSLSYRIPLPCYRYYML